MILPGAIIAVGCWAIIAVALILVLLADAKRPARPVERWAPEAVNIDWLYGLEDDAEVMLTAADREDLRCWGVTW